MNLIEFEWGRCIDGYRVVKDSRGDQDVIAVSTRFELYRPVEFPVLFQTFADTPADVGGALNFVNKFGALGGLGNIRQGNEQFHSFIEFQSSLRQAIDLAQAADWAGLIECYNKNQFGRGRLNSQLCHQPFGKVALVFVPTNLIQFLWLQFALHVGSDAKLLRCERCGAPFRVGTGTGRRDTAKFCSNACKVAAFRGRQINA